ncbi:MAG TPA: phosphoribosyl-AMP cyclohydrolase [Candidatus Nesterenkonia stercoripullorum]|uniref:Phosphoribosyl-AMP cyclohydrolase n=1 Tax=Candidatus Nesterenkonia stercoripullorum TaxID=2838701 RepID=A0A9D1USB0_9MICC|nr:phosphoribosyl-AMP cyclohydrolase [Candidatus Nesterenkonia stercoripullorum]
MTDAGSAGATGLSAVAVPLTANPAEVLEKVSFSADGLVPAIAQDSANGEVLMMAWMNAKSLEQTLLTGRATYWSRSRGELWRKGETSGHLQTVEQISLDCDGDTVLMQVSQQGPACHTGTRSCFTGRVVASAADRSDEGGQRA